MSNAESYDTTIDHIYELIHSAKLAQAQQKITEIQNKTTEVEIAECFLLEKLGKYDELFKKATLLYQLSGTMSLDIQLAAITVMTYAYLRTNNSRFIYLFKDGERIFKELSDNNEESRHRSEVLANYLELKAHVAISNGHISNALIYLNKVIDYRNINQNMSKVMSTNMYIGSIYYNDGAFSQALKHYTMSLEQQENDSIAPSQAEIYFRIGEISYRLGKREEALEFLEKAEQIACDSDKLMLAEIHYYQVQILAYQGKIEPLKTYKTKFDQLATRIDNAKVELMSKLTDAIILMLSTRIRFKARAQQILFDIVDSEVIDIKLSIFAMLKLSQLLIDEIRAFNSDEAHHTLVILLNRFYKYAKAAKNYATIIDILIFKARILLIDGRFNEIDMVIENAERIAKMQDLTHHIEKVNRFKKQIKDEILRLESVVRKHGPMRQRIEIFRMQEYLQDILDNSTKYAIDQE